MDLDHFKFVNDSLGHSTGDLLLKAMAERLRTVLREGDTVGRVGGDEFVLILNDQSNEEIIYRAMQRISAKVAEPITIDGKELYVSCSAGISIYPQDGRDVDTLLKNADAAMYRAKDHGRSNFQFYTSEMNERVNERLALENALRRALERQELILHYQQKVSLQTGQIVGCEALVRWLHPGVGLVRPGALHPARRGDRAHRQHRRMGAARGLPPVARLDGRRPAARRGVGQPLGAPVPPGRPGAHRVAHPGETRLDPAQLEMELTESMVMGNVDQAIAVLQGLKQLGVTLSVDDFGTGYSSLSYLKDLPIDTLKIDRSFVRDIGSGDEADDGVLAQAIISLGHALHLKVIAEGVETDAQNALPARHACDEVQASSTASRCRPEHTASCSSKPSERLEK
jgi:diguanylate cyclase (GGDEF)-like protein